MTELATTFSWKPLAPSFGADVQGIDITRPVDPETARQLQDLWNERGLLRFRGQSVDLAGYVAFSATFGELEIHPSKANHAEGFSHLLSMKYDPAERDRTPSYRVGGEELALWQPWHIDMIYTTKMDRGGLLMAKVVPPHGGLTGFIDRVALLENMPADLRRRIEGRRVMYQLEPRFDRVPYLPYDAVRLHLPESTLRILERRETDMPIVTHPAIMRHPITGVENLAVSPTHSIGFEDMDEAESAALMEELVGYIVQSPGKFHQEWQVDDIVLWDNWRFMHMAGGCPVDHARQLYRAGIKGDYTEGRVSSRAGEGARAWTSGD